MVPSLVVFIRGAKWSIRDRSGRWAQELRDQARYIGLRRQVGSA